MCPQRPLRVTLSQMADEEFPGTPHGIGVPTTHSIRGSGAAVEALDGGLAYVTWGGGRQCPHTEEAWNSDGD